MENLFVENEEISYIVIVGDPVYDIYKYDKINFINDQLSRDVVVNQSQTMISREGVHVCNHHNHINNGVIMRSIESQGIVYENKEIVDVLSHYLKEHIKTKLRWLVMCFANVVLKIKVMVRKNYILLFEEYYLWKSRKRLEVLMKISSLESFELEDHG